MDFGQRVQHMRIVLGLTVMSLAAEAGMTMERLQAIERGAPATIRQRIGLARALGVTVPYLDHGEGDGLMARPALRALLLQMEKVGPERADELCIIFATAVRRAIAGKDIDL